MFHINNSVGEEEMDTLTYLEGIAHKKREEYVVPAVMG